MKPLSRVMAGVAVASVIVFVGSLALVITTDGRHELAAKICVYSLVFSFFSLILYQPKEPEDQLE